MTSNAILNTGYLSQVTVLNRNVATEGFPVKTGVETKEDNALSKDTLILSEGGKLANKAGCECGKCDWCLAHRAQESEESGKSNEDDSNPTSKELTEEEKEKVEELQKRDKEVRAHEQAHVAAGATSARYEYETGPDGKKYAVGGNASIETSDVPNDPEATIRKAQKIQRAALAPSDPSPKDRQVAAEARQMEAKARQELMEEKLSKIKGDETDANGKPVDEDKPQPIEQSIDVGEGNESLTKKLEKNRIAQFTYKNKFTYLQEVKGSALEVYA